jgi:EH domain-containing protein 1
MNASMATPPASDEMADRTSVITGRLKTIYRKSVLPVEKKYSYDYFYESPLLTDVEFDGTNE